MTRGFLVAMAIFALLLSALTVARPALAVESNQVALHNTEADPGSEEECQDVAEGSILFHFVLNNLTPDSTLTNFMATFDPATTFTYEARVINSTVTHVDVTITGEADLVDAVASFDKEQPTGPSGAKLVLSHVCEGAGSETAPDLTLVKSANHLEVAAGDSYTYTITGTNIGDADATGVVISDDLDDHLIVDGATYSFPDGSGSHDCEIHTGNVIVCNVSLLKAAGIAGDDVVVTIAVSTPDDLCGDVVNTSTIGSNETEGEHSNTVTVTVVCGGETGSVTIIKETNPDTVDPSHTFNFDPSWEGEDFQLGNTESVTHNLAPGMYTVVEDEIDGFELTHIVCEGDTGEVHLSSGDVDSRTASIDLQVGEDVTCTFTNMVEEEDTTIEVMVMKHLCPDISTTDEFEAIEAAAREEAANSGLDENEAFAALAATVVACPTIILSADVPMDHAPLAQTGEFEFTVLDANGTQILSTDGAFADAKLCETDISVDVDNSGTFDSDVCLDVSHYGFEVEGGIVTITETDAPGSESFFGTIRFTPGSGDDEALVGSIGEVEMSGGVIVLDTTLATDEAVADGIMVHVYNFTPDGGQQGNGSVEIDKQFCASDEGTRTDIDVNEPIGLPGSLSIQREAQAPEDGCAGGDATFEAFMADVNGDPTGDPVATESTGDDGSVTFDLDAGTYVIVETETGASATFMVEADMLTIIDVTNFESGLVKVIKESCDGDSDAVLFSINGSAVTGFDATTCEESDALFRIGDGDAFATVDGEALAFTEVGTNTLTEIGPNSATSAAFEVAFAEKGEFSPITTIRVLNISDDEDAQTATSQVMVMKHLCPEVNDVAEFQAIEAAARAAQPNNTLDDLAALAATVANCPAVVENSTTDQQTTSADVGGRTVVAGGDSDFDFAVVDSKGLQTLTANGAFSKAHLCAADVGLAGQFGDVCLDTSHYGFTVMDGQVFIVETEEPDNADFGTIRFTPGSGDQLALQGTIAQVEASGLIGLDTRNDNPNDGMVMVHVYNFTEASAGTPPITGGGSGTLGGSGGPATVATPPSRSGTLAGSGGPGGSLPNTATAPVSSTLPAAVLALVLLTGLGAASYAVTAEARRRQ